MTKKIKCQGLSELVTQNVKVKVIRAPVVDSGQLRRIIFSRTKALVL